jgi:hypothetical protein
MSIIKLPVSLGEAVDKLTILDIKLERITDNRKKDVETEYTILYEELKGFIQKYNELYCSMKKVNILIWDMMDILRDGDVSDEVYMKVCKECIEYNDIRFRIKNKINILSKSELKEQKSYKINRLLIQIDSSISIEDCKKPVQYISFFYDEVIIIYNSDNDIQIFDPTIIIIKQMDTDNTIDYKKKIVLSNLLNIYETFEITESEIKRLL